MIGSLTGILLLYFVVWGHYMFMTGMNSFLSLVYMFLTLIIAVPSTAATINWPGTL